MPRTVEAFRKLCERRPLNYLFLLLFLLSDFFLIFVLDGLLVFAADELDQSHFGAVAFARAEFEDSRVSTRTVGESVRQLSGQFLQGRDAGGSFGVRLMFFAFRPGVAGEEKRRRLTRGVHRGFVLAGLAGGSRPAAQGDSFFGKGAQFFRLRQRSDDSFVKHKGRAKVSQQRFPVRRCPPQLSVRNKVSHDFYSSA